MRISKIKSAFFHLADVASHIIPMSNNVVFFNSFNGLYNDNPKYISEKLHELSPNLQLIWVIDKRANSEDIPSYVKRVKRNTFKYVYYKNRAKVLIDNFEGFICRYTSNRWLFRVFKKRGQVNYSTWHGTPLKKIGVDRYDSDYKKLLFTTSTNFLLNSDYISKIFNQVVSNEVPIDLIGSPRNDLLFENRIEIINRTKEKLGLPINKKIVLYAPTYRSTNKNIDGETYSIYMNPSDVMLCLNSLKKRFGGDWVFIYRVHNMISRLVQDNADGIVTFNGNMHDDMAEYLLVSDVLITDYSGSLFDYTITKRPCFLYVPDYDSYCNDGRGVYMDLKDLPYSSASNIETLVDVIENYETLNAIPEIEEFNQKMGLVDDGNASFRISQKILDVLLTK